MKTYTEAQYYEFYENFNRRTLKPINTPEITEEWRDCNNMEFRGVLCHCVRWFDEFQKQISAFDKCSNCLNRGFPPISVNDLLEGDTNETGYSIVLAFSNDGVC
jgi:hypothetical protein